MYFIIFDRRLNTDCAIVDYELSSSEKCNLNTFLKYFTKTSISLTKF